MSSRRYGLSVENKDFGRHVFKRAVNRVKKYSKSNMSDRIACWKLVHLEWTGRASTNLRGAFWKRPAKLSLQAVSKSSRGSSGGYKMCVKLPISVVEAVRKRQQAANKKAALKISFAKIGRRKRELSES